MQKRYLPALLTGALALLAQAALAATGINMLPEPGLYQIDTDSTHTVVEVGAVVETHIDGKTGATRTRNTVRGQTSGYNMPGSGQQTNCVKPYTGDFHWTAALAASCPKQTNKVVDVNTMIHTAECPGTKQTQKIVKIDDKTWQIDTRIETAKTSAGPAHPLNGMEQLLKTQAALAQTSAEREEAQALLDKMPETRKQYEQAQKEAIDQMKAVQATAKEPEIQAAAAKALANMQNIGVPQNFVDVIHQRWTRIGNCPGIGKPLH